MEQAKTAIFAGNDELSRLAVDRLSGQGDVVVLSQMPLDYATPAHYLVDIGNLTAAVEIFLKERITRIVFAGRVEQAALFAGPVHESGEKFLAGLADWTGENILAKLAEFLRARGVEVVPLPEIFGPELAEKFVCTRRKPDESEQRDISHGAEVLRAILPYRIGQSVAVKKGVILAVEGIEGTDRMIERAGTLGRDFAVVKMAGPEKDVRFDLPAVGMETVRMMQRSGGKVLAVEAGKTLIVNKKKVVELCNEFGIALVGI